MGFGIGWQARKAVFAGLFQVIRSFYAFVSPMILPFSRCTVAISLVHTFYEPRADDSRSSRKNTIRAILGHWRHSRRGTPDFHPFLSLKIG
jgi:hypothetical protein